MILQILRHRFPGIKAFFYLGMSDVTTHDDSTVERKTCGYWILVKLLKNLLHRTVEIYLYNLSFPCIAKFLRYQFTGEFIKFLYPQTLSVYFRFHVTVGRTADAHTDRT